ncbi:MAG: protein kinase [Planctomycetes bacterium]|nr:protein kinase [Planctomycetota bacterium]MCB9901408.1 protein kinase [Planctomycetota bacterium]
MAAEEILELADAYLAHLDAGGGLDPESFLQERGVSSAEALDLLRTLASIEGEHGRLPAPGEHVGPYRVLARIGRGGMGVVYRAEDTRLGRAVALKVCRRAALPEHGEERFEREARALASLRHPHVVQVFDLGGSRALIWYAMELHEGRTLEDVLADGPWALPYAELASRFADVAEALDAVHEAGLVHRDVKPSNLLLRPDERLVLADFGVVHWDEASTLTSTRDLPGTPAYMAPEQVRGDPPDTAADQYGLAACLYQAITGDWPLRHLGLKDVLAERSRLGLALPRTLRPDVPEALEAAVLRGLALEPGSRHPDLKAFATALRAVALTPGSRDLWCGRRLGDYEVLERLGTGAMGAVYRARAVDDEHDVALKILHPHRIGGGDALQRIRREAEAGSRVLDEHVLRTHACAIEVVDGAPVVYLVLELVPGRTLRELLGDVGPLPEPLLVEVARQAALGLAAIHEAGIVHRDVKPDNLMIDDAQRVRVMDLGVAAVAGDETSGGFVGSLRYAAPEQIEGHAVGPTADLYALGVTLYELAAGVPPFSADDPRRLVRLHLEAAPRFPLRDDAPLGPFFEGVLETLLAKLPEERFASAAELAAVLETGESGSWWLANRDRRSGGRHAAWPEVPVRRATRLVGRDVLRAALDARVDALRHGQGGVLVLRGEAGVGKSRLLDALLRAEAGRGTRAIYASFADESDVAALLAGLAAHLGPGDPTPFLERALGAAPPLVPGLANALQGGGSGGLEPAALRRGVRLVAESLARTTPTVWVVDDLHAADEAARDAVFVLARATRDAPLLMILTTEPGPDEAWAPALAGLAVDVRDVGRLDAASIETLVGSVFGSAPFVAELAARLHEVSDGLPFVVVEVLHALVDRGIVRPDGEGGWRAELPVDRFDLPDAVQGLLTSRLAELDDDERRVLELGAVAGVTFDPDLVARALGMTRLQVLQTLVHVERRTRLVRSGRTGVQLDVPRLRELLVAGLGDELRGEAHASLAEARAARAEAQGGAGGEDAVFIASHHVLGPRPEAAVPWLLPAAKHLRGTGRTTEGAELLERAKARPIQGLAPRTAVALELARIECLVDIGRMAEAGDALTQAVRDEGPASGPAEMLALRRLQGLWLVRRGRLAEARPWTVEAIELATALEAPGEGAACRLLAADVALDAGEWAAARGHLDEAVQLAERAGDTPTRLDAIARGAEAAALDGALAQALRLADQAIEVAATLPPSSAAGKAHLVLARVLHALGRLPGSLDAATKALRLATALGDRRLSVQASAARALVTKEGDDPAAAYAAFLDVRAARRALDDAYGLARDELECFLAARRLGRGDDARAHLVAAHELAGRVGSLGLELRVEAGRALGGLADAAAVRERLERDQSRLAPLHAVAAWWWVAQGGGGVAAEQRAREALDHLVAGAPPEDRDTLVSQIALHREVAG